MKEPQAEKDSGEWQGKTTDAELPELARCAEKGISRNLDLVVSTHHDPNAKALPCKRPLVPFPGCGAATEGETASGWQQAQLATPIAIEANILYVVSYHTQVGHYSFDGAYLAADRENGPLVAPASAAAGGNGVFAYGATSVFPGNSFNATNYWVDVVFEDGAPDPNPPSVVSTTPAAGAGGAGVTDDVFAVFSKAMDASSIDGTTFALRDAGGDVVPATVTYEAGAFPTTIATPPSPTA